MHKLLRPDCEALAKRWQSFYNCEKKGAALIQIKGIQSLEDHTPPMRPLNAWRFPEEMAEYLDECAKRKIPYWRQRVDLEDDTFPTLQPWYGVAEHTAFLGGAVDFSETTSYNHTILPDWADFGKLKLDEHNLFLRLVLDGMRHYHSRWGDAFLARLRGASGVSDIANAVRGNELFYDVYDEPDKVRALADFCADAASFTLELQKKEAPRIGGGFINGFDLWMPERSIGHISEDASCMMSPEQYAALFLDALRKLCDDYDYVMLHVHSMGKRQLPNFMQLPQIHVVELTSDPNYDRAVQVLEEYSDLLSGRILTLALTREELEANTDLLAEHKTVLWYRAKDLNDAREVCTWIHGKFPLD